jgi:hypothetical protein
MGLRFEILPGEGAGALRFGMERDVVRRTMQLPVTPFRKTERSPTLTDAFRGAGIHVFYDEGDRCEAIELSKPARVTLNGNSLLGVSFAEGEGTLRALDPAAVTDSDGCTSFALGVSLYCPADVDWQREGIQAVLVFRNGYFDSGSD